MAVDSRGRTAEKPQDIPAKGWKDIAYRVKEQVREDNVPLLSAGVAFYGLLALFPAIVAIVSLYGLVASPHEVATNIQSFTRAMPREAREVVTKQLQQVTGGDNGGLTLGLIVSLLAVIWTASSGVQALVKAINVTYDEKESRKFVRLRGLALLLTIAALLLTVVALGAIIGVPALLHKVGLGAAGEWLISILRWPLLGVLIIASLAVLYRYSPDRDNPEWRWVSWGAVVATVVWLLGSILFSVYVDNFGKYNKTYGTLGAVIVLMLWLYLSAFAVLLGAELDAEMELQTAEDTTTGPDQPMGERQAYAADHVGDPAPSKG